MMRPKGCRHCGGDLYEEQDYDAEGDLVCIQCGRTHVPARPAVAELVPGPRGTSRVSGRERVPQRTKLSA